MKQKLKLKKCRRCKTEFQPMTEWQKYCSSRCRSAVGNRRRAVMLRRAEKLLQAQEGAA